MSFFIFVLFDFILFSITKIILNRFWLVYDNNTSNNNISEHFNGENYFELDSYGFQMINSQIILYRHLLLAYACYL